MKRSIVQLFLLLQFSCIRGIIQAQSIFEVPVPFFSITNGQIGQIITCDLNGDNIPTLCVITNNIYSNVHFFDLTGVQPYSPMKSIQLSKSTWTYGSTICQEIDMDLDGDLDLIGYDNSFSPYNDCFVFALENTNNSYYTFRCLGELIGTNAAYAFRFYQFTIFDVSGDGYPDILIDGAWKQLFAGQPEYGEQFVLIQTSPFEFADGSLVLPIQFFRKRYDVDEDGLDDLLVAPSPDSLVVYKNIGNGQFQHQLPLSLVGTSVYSWMDADNDGSPELITKSSFFSNFRIEYHDLSLTEISQGQLLLNDTMPDIFGPGYENYTPLDVENDGDIDVFRWYYTGNGIWQIDLYLNEGDEPLISSSYVIDGTILRSIFLDIDGDDDLDIVFKLNNTLYYMRNIIPHPSTSPTDENPLYSIYPNPAHDLIHIHLSDAIQKHDLSITDITGRTINKFNTVDHLEEISLSQLSYGCYFLHIYNGDSGEHLKTMKFVKK